MELDENIRQAYSAAGMTFSDSAIKERLEHVYWLIGTSCAGKTTMAKAIAAKHQMVYYDWNDHYARFKAAANPDHQPYLSKVFEGPDELFSQPIPEYVEHLFGQTEEAFEMVVEDHLGMDRSVPSITETIHVVDLVARIAEPNRIAFLYVQEELHREQNWKRDDAERRAILEYMNRTSNATKYMNHMTEVGVVAGALMIAAARRSDVQLFERTRDTTVARMLGRLEQHYGLV